MTVLILEVLRTLREMTKVIEIIIVKLTMTMIRNSGMKDFGNNDSKYFNNVSNKRL